MEQVWFSADHHFGHESIISYCRRPFASVTEMDAAMVAKWNACVSPADTVYYLGDLASSAESASAALSVLQGRKILVIGNHDRRWFPDASEFEQIQRCLRAIGWADVVTDLRLRMPNKASVLLHHYPFRGSFSYPGKELGEELFAPEDHGELLLHGHVHDAWKQNGRMINVGVDAWDFAPIASETVMTLLAPFCGV